MYVYDLSGNLGGFLMRGIVLMQWMIFYCFFNKFFINVYIKLWRKLLGNEKLRKISFGEFFFGDMLG